MDFIELVDKDYCLTMIIPTFLKIFMLMYQSRDLKMAAEALENTDLNNYRDDQKAIVEISVKKVKIIAYIFAGGIYGFLVFWIAIPLLGDEKTLAMELMLPFGLDAKEDFWLFFYTLISMRK